MIGMTAAIMIRVPKTTQLALPQGLTAQIFAENVFAILRVTLDTLWVKRRKETMLTIEKKYVVDENNRHVAVLVDMGTFERIKQILEDYALGRLMEEVEAEPSLDLEDAQVEYSRLQREAQG